MQSWRSAEEIPASFGPSVVAVGTFDGVHRGHQVLLRELVAQARARSAQAVVITFDPHPVAVLFPDRAPVALMSLEQRVAALADLGVDAVLVAQFTPEFAATSAEDFVTQTLVERLGMTAIVAGADMRFGHRNAGDIDLLRTMGEQHDFEVVIVADQGEGDTQRWSSSAIRQAISDGRVDQAAAALGRPHAVVGTVVHGDHRGRDLGFPTANLAAADLGAVPADGVYAGYLQVLSPGEHPQFGEHLPAAISVGTNPTFDGVQRRVEAYVIDRSDLDLYGASVRVEFTDRLRETVRFEGLDALIVQMQADVQRCREILAVRH